MIIVTIAANTPTETLAIIGKFFGLSESFSIHLEGAEAWNVITSWLMRAYLICTLILLVLTTLFRFIYEKITKKELKIDPWQGFKYILIFAIAILIINQAIFIAYGNSNAGYLVADIIWLIITILLLFLYHLFNNIANKINMNIEETVIKN